jgi:HPt (histidine-containing phosphotransfer) domain-containing protein
MAGNESGAAGDARYAEVLARLREIGLLDERSFLTETSDLFMTDAQAAVGQMQDAFSSGDLHALREASHRLKGAALNLGVTTVATPAQQVEERARRGEFAGAPAALATIESELLRVGAWFKQLASAPFPPS